MMIENANSVMNFIIPVRHHSSVKDWDAVVARMHHSFLSLIAQTSQSWRATIVANYGCPLPPLDERFDIVHVDIPAITLPSEKLEPDKFYNMVRLDKGSRVAAGMKNMRPAHYCMIMDFDDFINKSLVSFVETNSGGPGWVINDGFFFDGSEMLYLCKNDFNKFCGSSLIVRSDFYKPTDVNSNFDSDYVKRSLGSHRSLVNDLAQSGQPLAPLPMVGAAYRIGYAGNTSRSGGIMPKMFGLKTSLGHPIRTTRRLASLRRMNREIEETFFYGDHRLSSVLHAEK